MIRALAPNRPPPSEARVTRRSCAASKHREPIRRAHLRLADDSKQLACRLRGSRKLLIALLAFCHDKDTSSARVELILPRPYPRFVGVHFCAVPEQQTLCLSGTEPGHVSCSLSVACA